MKKQISLILLTIALSLNACLPSLEQPIPRTGNEGSPTAIRIFADAILQNALTEIGKNYEASHPGSTVQLSFSNSKHLRELIEEGKSGDMLVSAIPSETASLTDKGYIHAVDSKKLSTSRLVLAVPSGNPGNIQSAKDLSQPGLKLGMVAETKPLGELTRTVLGNLNATYGADYMNLVMANVTVSEEDVQVILTKLQSGEINACIVDSFEIATKPEFTLIEIPAEANGYRQYDISILAQSTKRDEASRFMDYIFLPESQAVLTKWGFTVQ
jgi:molybdate transport system substrate-binding protein